MEVAEQSRVRRGGRRAEQSSPWRSPSRAEFAVEVVEVAEQSSQFAEQVVQSSQVRSKCFSLDLKV
jgi:hypothetical protein